MSAARCEWVYINGQRCRNVLSLIRHHRTYDRYRHELESDFSILCPVHHFIADIQRKVHINTRQDILEEWAIYVLDQKRSKIDRETWSKFSLRLELEWERVSSEFEDGRKALIDLADRIKSDSTIEIDDNDGLRMLKNALWYILIRNVCYQDNLIDGLVPMASKTLSILPNRIEA